MTIDKKRSFVFGYCADHECGDCKLCDTWKYSDEQCISISEASETELDWAMDIISGTKSDSVNHPSHYQGNHECIDEMIALFGVKAVKHFCMCNVYKYRFRAANKNGQEDLDKADWYMDKLMELGGKADD